MRSGLATVSISGTLAQKLDAIAGAGFDGFELFETDLVTSSLTPEQVADRAESLGLTLDLYQPFRDFEGVNAERFRDGLRRAERKFALMERLGADTILVCSNVATAEIGDDALAIEQLGMLAETAQRHGVRVAYEALAWGRYVSTYDHAWRLVQEVNHPALGVCLDSFHILSRRSSLDTLDHIPGEKIFFCQLADAPRMSLDVLSWSRHHRVFPGEGSWDLASFVARLVRAGYRGPLSLEVFNDVFRQGDPALTARDARRSLVALEDAAAAEMVRSAAAPVASAVASGDRDGCVVDLAGLPQLDVTRGFSFIELRPGVDDRVETLLGHLGFEYRGRHLRKNAELWSQGSVHIIVNTDLFGDTARIAAIGVEVSDLAPASRRAVALHSALLPRDRAGAEEVLTAIVAPDGTELYFSQRRGEVPGWVAEFSAPSALSALSAPAAATTPAYPSVTGITRVDHVALVQPWQRADEAALFYQSILGLTADEGLDLAGESGLVHSRSLVTPDRSIRLALNVVPGQGAGDSDYPNHLALQTDDLLHTVSVLRERGLTLLPIPENYYDDLDARLNLGEATIEQLRSREILYDRDERGEFWHVYTPAIGGFFVELVQRGGSYDGYGAANAPIRLAAQRAHKAFASP